VRVTAIVVRWRGGAEVERCLDSLLAQRGDRLQRVILVDSGSGDGGAGRLAAAYSDITVLALPVNHSFAHAANRGVVEADTDAVLLLNPDTELEPDTVGTLANALDGRPRAAGVVPLLVNEDGTSQHRWQLRRLPTVARLAVGLPGAPAFDSPPTTAAAIEQPAAAAWLVRRAVWQALGGLDESFAPAWWEDVDFCARLRRMVGTAGGAADAGFEVVPRAAARHAGGLSARRLETGRFTTIYFSNLLRYAARHEPHRLALVRLSLRASLLVRAALRPRRAAAYVNASHTMAHPDGR
jgi:GT2 family glycosyltransferase